MLRFMTVEIEKSLNKCSLFGRIARRKPQNMAAQLRFVKLDVSKPQDF